MPKFHGAYEEAHASVILGAAPQVQFTLGKKVARIPLGLHSPKKSIDEWRYRYQSIRVLAIQTKS